MASSEANNGGIGEGGNEARAANENVYRQYWYQQRRPDPSEIQPEIMQVAEEMTLKEVLFKIHPTLDEQEKRADITFFLQKIISQSFEGIEVFPYGSVSLKTYLKDGDIDLTVICKPDMKDSLAEEICALLKNEEQNMYAEYTVKETKMIDAEVKLVRCKVNNVSVDISFNQLGGLSKSCFLEQIDRKVNKNHLFKLSVLLIKAWWHYECRALGPVHGLLATYALEALILCIFQMFSSSLNGPLAVMYRFLDYYGKFDWNKCSISLDGPVRTSSLPRVVVTDLGNGGAELLLSQEDRISLMDLFAFSSYNIKQDNRSFVAANLNIIDPLKENNNLGRSVNTANCIRMRAAFSYGARRLGRILQLPKERIAAQVKKFFQCTLTKYGCTGEEDMHLTSIEGAHIDELMLDSEGGWLPTNVRDPVTARFLDMEAVENLLDLAGDYASLARGYVHGLCTLGFSTTLPGLGIPPLTTAQYQEMVMTWNNSLWNVEENVASWGQRINSGNSYLCGTGTYYIPNMDSTSDELISTPGPSQKDNTEGNGEAVEGRRIPEKSINLDSEYEFPPLR